MAEHTRRAVLAPPLSGRRRPSRTLSPGATRRKAPSRPARSFPIRSDDSYAKPPPRRTRNTEVLRARPRRSAQGATPSDDVDPLDAGLLNLAANVTTQVDRRRTGLLVQPPVAR